MADADENAVAIPDWAMAAEDDERLALHSDPAERFSMLAAAVAGYRVAVVGGAGERSYSDGEKIVVSDGDEDAVRDGLVVQAALIAAGSLDGRTVARLTGRRRQRLRYLTLEARRATDALGVAVPRRVSDRVAGVYDGAVSASTAESLERALAYKEPVPEAPGWLGTIRPGKVLMAGPLLGAGSPTDKDRAGTSKEVDMPELDDEEDSERSKIMELFQAPAMQNPLAQYLQKLLGMGRNPKAEGGGGDELPVGSHKAGKVGAQAKVVDDAAARKVDLGGPPVGHLYPEYNWHRGGYRRDWCAVAEYDPRHGDHEAALDAGHDMPLRRELARLGLAHERHRRQEEGDVLDITALIEFVVDKGMGAAGDDRVYETKRRTAHDLGVLVLLDATGSTGESEEGRRVFDDQREIAARLTSALDELGDRVAAFGFQSWGRQSVHFLRIKDFDGRYDHAAQRRLACLEPAGFTRLGAAIRHGTHLLSTKAGTSNTLLVVVGDGLPYDDGYEHRYAQEDCRRALEEAVVAGVGCACVSVRTSTEQDVLERLWGHVPYQALERPSELSRHVTPLFRRALKEAAASRRRAGRTPYAVADPETEREQAMS
jgi:hypothetical protein